MISGFVHKKYAHGRYPETVQKYVNDLVPLEIKSIINSLLHITAFSICLIINKRKKHSNPIEIHFTFWLIQAAVIFPQVALTMWVRIKAKLTQPIFTHSDSPDGPALLQKALHQSGEPTGKLSVHLPNPNAVLQICEVIFFRISSPVKQKKYLPSVLGEVQSQPARGLLSLRHANLYRQPFQASRSFKFYSIVLNL